MKKAKEEKPEFVGIDLENLDSEDKGLSDMVSEVL